MSELAVIFAKVVRHNSHCVVCHGINPQYHHVNPADKLSEVSRVARTGDLPLTIKEINKCIPLCQTHHTAVHKGAIPGYLEGKYDNGTTSDDIFAKPYMPYLPWFAKRKKHVLMEFYREFVEKDGDALMSVFNAANLSLPGRPRLRLVEAGQRTVHSALGNKVPPTMAPSWHHPVSSLCQRQHPSLGDPISLSEYLTPFLDFFCGTIVGLNPKR